MLVKKKFKNMAVVSIILGHGYTSEDNLNNDTNDDILCKCGCE